jgi:hypothetical protein
LSSGYDRLRFNPRRPSLRIRNPDSDHARVDRGLHAAIGETNPLYRIAVASAGPHGGIVAPPSLAAIFGDGENIFRHYPQFDTRRLLAGIDVEYLTPIRAGDSLTTISQIKEIYEKTGRSGPMVFIVISSSLRKQNGEVAARIDYRFTSPR